MKRALTCMAFILSCLVSFSAARAADPVPPAEVSNLTVTRSGNNVVMSWDAVTLNLLGGPETIGSYRVYRGTMGSFVPDKPGGTNRIGTPATNGFSDVGGITAPGNFFYLISGVDTTGNEGNTRRSRVTATSNLSSSFSSSAANLSWTDASPLANVGGYLVMWGTTPGVYDNGQDVGNTTNAAITSLLPGITYFFAILPYDTAGNYFLLSNETSGALLGGNGPTEVCGRIDSPTTWALAGSPFIVTCDVNVWQTGPFNLAPPPPAILTIEPGVVVKFNANTALTIGNGTNPGKLIAQGTAPAPILFTANQTFPLPGAWRGIFFTDGADDTSILERASVQFAGLALTSGAALTLTSAVPTVRNVAISGSLNYGIFLQTLSPAALQAITIDNVAGAGIRSDNGSPSITGSSITNAGGYALSIAGVNSAVIQNNSLDHGLFFESASGEPIITGNTFLRMAGQVNRVGANDVGEYFGSNTHQGGLATQLDILSERVDTNATWPNPGYPLLLLSSATQVFGDVVNAVTLTLQPGLQVRFGTSAYIQIGSGTNRGALVAAGTAGQPILFTTNNATPAPGQWSGIFFDDGADDTTSLIEHATIEYTGSIFQSGVRVSASSPRLRNLTVRHSSVYGIYLSNSSALIENSSISNTGNNGIRSDGGGSPTVRGCNVASPTGYGILISSTNSARIENNQVANAIQFDSAAGDPIITGNAFTNFDTFPPRVGADDVAEMVQSNTLQNATAAGRLEILGEPLSTSATWPKPVFPYVAFSGDITVGNSPATLVTLTIAAGNTIRFNSSTNLIVGTTVNRGALVAVGTIPLPIIFTTNNATPAPGQWAGILFEDQSDDATSILDRCVVEYSGQTFSGNVRVNAASPRILNSTIRNSSVRGIYGITSPSPIIQGNTFTGNVEFDVYISGTSNTPVTGNTFNSSGVFFDTAAGTHAVTGNTFNSYNNATRNSRTGAHAIGALGTNTFNGTGANSRWEILGEALSANATWPNPGLPYVMLSDVTVGNSPVTLVTLTLAAGANLRFNSGVSLNVGTSVNRGSLVAVGTVPLPITFTTNNAVPAPGQWPGIFFEDQSEDAASILDLCVVEYAGQSFSSSVRVNAASPRILNSTIRNSSVRGIYGITAPSPIIQNNIFTGNTEFDVYISGVSNAQVTGNSFTSNGVFFDTAAGTHTVTGNIFNAYNNAARNTRVGAHAVASLGSNIFNGTGAASRIEVLGETLTADATWPGLAVPYAILGNVVIAKDSVNSATLTISPGANLRFGPGIGLFIGTTVAKGALVADGTVGQPITFTTNNATPAPGQWTAVYFDSMSVAATNLMDFCIVEYGGATYSANVRMASSAGTVSNSTIRNSSVHGIYGTGSPAPLIQSNTFAGNAQYDVFMDGGNAQILGNTMVHAARIDAAAGSAVVQNNVFNTYIAPFLLRVSASSIDSLTGNTFNGTNATSKIEILGETIAGDHRWRNPGLPYAMLNSVTVGGTATVAAKLTIDPGVTTRWAASTRFIIATTSVQGELKALGTIAQPITFTTDANTPAAGQWQGIYLDNGTTFDTELDRVIVEYAGQTSTAGIWLNRADPPIRNTTIRFSSWYGLVSVDSSPLLDSVTVNSTGNNGMILQGFSAERTPTITNCTVSAPTGYGILNQGTMTPSIMNSTVDNSISFESAAGSPIVQNNVLNNYDPFPLRIGADSVANLTGNTLNGTGVNSRIEILGETVATDATWANLGVPYSIVSGFVTVAKNATSAATLTLPAGVTLKFGTGTRLQIASGTSMGALVAVGTTGQPITFTSNNAVPAPGQWRGIYFDSGTVDATTILQNSVVEFAGQTDNGNIIVVSSSPTIRNNIIRRSSQYGVVFSSAGGQLLFNNIENNLAHGIFLTLSAPTIQHNSFTGNTTGAVNQTGTNLVDARMNWYGDATGPSGSGPGTGQAVTANVVFDPWLGSTQTTTNFFGDMFISTRTFMPGALTRYIGALQQNSDWTLRLFDTGNTVVRTINGSGTAISTTWDGRDNGAVNLVNGIYRFQFDATATVGGALAAPVVGRVTLDNTFANGAVTAPTHLQTVSIGTLLPVIGTAAGTNFTNYSLQFGAGLFPTAFTNIITSTSQVNGAALGTWNTGSQNNGIYSVRLLVNNNLAEQTVVNVGTFVLAVNTLALDRQFFSPNGDTNLDDVTATSTLSTPASWTINVVNTGTTATVRTFTGSGQSITQTWDGTLSNGTTVAPEGNYRFDLTATSGGQNVASSSASTALDLTPPTAVITSPADPSEVFTRVAVQGTATDPDLHFLSYILEFGVGQTPLSYTQVATATTPVVAGPLGSWVTNNFEPTEPIPNGGYQLRLRVMDRAGNTSIDSAQVNVDNLVLGNVASVPKLLDISQGQTAQITFSINKPAAVTVKVYPETAGEAGPIQRQFTGNFSAGNHALVWDGRSDAAQFLPDEAYVIVVEADAGSGRTDKFSPSGGLSVGSGFGTVDPAYNPYTNDFWSMLYTNQFDGRVTMQVTPTAQPTFDVFTLEPHQVESFQIEWDGRKPNGDFVTVASSIYFPPPTTLRPHYMLTKGNTPRISGIKSDPYRLFMSYAHVSRLSFTLERDSLVTLTLLPPGISNPADPSGRQLLTSQLMTVGPHEVLFDPVNAGIANEDTFLFDEEGPYTFAIQTVNAATGATSLRRGVVSMFR